MPRVHLSSTSLPLPPLPPFRPFSTFSSLFSHLFLFLSPFSLFLRSLFVPFSVPSLLLSLSSLPFSPRLLRAFLPPRASPLPCLSSLCSRLVLLRPVPARLGLFARRVRPLAAPWPSAVASCCSSVVPVRCVVRASVPRCPTGFAPAGASALPVAARSRRCRGSSLVALVLARLVASALPLSSRARSRPLLARPPLLVGFSPAAPVPSASAPLCGFPAPPLLVLSSLLSPSLSFSLLPLSAAPLPARSSRLLVLLRRTSPALAPAPPPPSPSAPLLPLLAFPLPLSSCPPRRAPSSSPSSPSPLPPVPSSLPCRSPPSPLFRSLSYFARLAMFVEQG